MDLTLEAEPSGNQGNDMYIDQVCACVEIAWGCDVRDVRV